jgi:hypothetical protein
MADLEGAPFCCGIREIDGLSGHRTPEAVLKDLRGRFHEDHKWRHAVFSQAGKRSTYGKRFAAYITKEKLGTVVETETKVNPNSKNPLKAFIWTIDWDAMRKWLAARKKLNQEAWDDAENPDFPHNYSFDGWW